MEAYQSPAVVVDSPGMDGSDCIRVGNSTSEFFVDMESIFVKAIEAMEDEDDAALIESRKGEERIPMEDGFRDLGIA